MENVDENFEKAINKLREYEKRYPPNSAKPIAERMRLAKEKDKSSSKFLNKLKENWHVRKGSTFTLI